MDSLDPIEQDPLDVMIDQIEQDMTRVAMKIRTAQNKLKQLKLIQAQLYSNLRCLKSVHNCNMDAVGVSSDEDDTPTQQCKLSHDHFAKRKRTW